MLGRTLQNVTQLEIGKSLVGWQTKSSTNDYLGTARLDTSSRKISAPNSDMIYKARYRRKLSQKWLLLTPTLTRSARTSGLSKKAVAPSVVGTASKETEA